MHTLQIRDMIKGREKEKKNDAVRQCYIEKLEVYPSFPVAVGPSWVIQLWGEGGGGLPLAPTCCHVPRWVRVYVLLFPFLVHLSRYLLSLMMLPKQVV